MIFLISTIILRLARIEPGTSQTRFGSIQAFGLFICGTLVGYLAHFNNSLLLTVLLIISGFIRTPSDVHCSHDPVTPLLPSYRWLINTLALMCGTVVGLILTVTGTVVHGNNWFEIPFQTIKNLVVTQSTDKSEGTPFNFLGSFIGGSQIHLIILGAAVAVALIYLSYCLRVTDTFDVWIKGGDEDDNDAVLFSSSTKITIISTCLLLFHYIQNDSTLYQMHDVLVLTLVSGASGAYILYRGLYVYILKIVEPGKTTRNIVKLILYAELLLYMFESRMTFPTAMNKGIETWAHQGLWESSYVNLCLKYVNEQPDVTGVVIDYPVLMTGGFSLLGHQVPVWARHGHEFREWRMPDRFDLDGEPRKKFIMLNEVNDVVSLLNTPLLLKKVIEAPEYNYVVVTGKRKFPKRGFRKVFNASDVCVFKRSKSQSEKQYLLKLASEIPLGSNSTVLAYEGIRLLNFKLWEEAFRRLVVTTELQPSLTDAWRLLIVTLKQIDTTSVDKRKYDISTYTSRCLELHSSDCIVSDPSWLPKIDLTYDLDQISTTYKF